MYDPVDYLMFTFLGAICLAILGAVGFGVLDTVQSLRSRDAAYACVQRNLEPYRRDLSSRVVCRSRLTGADTLTVISK